MKFSLTVAVSLVVTVVDASVIQRAACPAVWNDVSSDLTKIFVGSDGQCTDDARAAVRAVFHDCGTWNTAQGTNGGCDGSLFLSTDELGRSENRGLQTISGKLQAIAKSRSVGVADMIAFAGAHATVSCPLGPTVKTMIGRKDSTTAGPESLLPGNASMDANTIITLFADKGFSAADVAALVGAHSSAKQFITAPAQAGESLDRTPGIWDVDYYNDTIVKPANVFILQSDVSLASDSRSGPTFKSFIGQQSQWNQAFADTFARLMLLGVSTIDLVDCTAALPAVQDSFDGANLPEPAGSAAPSTPGKPSAAPSKPSSPAGPNPPNGPGQGGFPTAKPTAPAGFPTQRPSSFPALGAQSTGNPFQRAKEVVGNKKLGW